MTALPTRVALWTVPRSVSTAFERAFMQLEGARVFHEPYGGPFYFGPERRSARFEDDAVDPSQSYGAITDELLAIHEGESTIFTKDMAYYVLPEEIRGMLGAFRNSFLIRDPRKSVPSLHRLSVDGERTGWTGFDGAEAGFVELRELFRFTTGELGQEAVVIDADDLLRDPPALLAAYCAEVGVPYDDGMLEWKAEQVPDWDVWNGWHEDAQGSTGFHRADGRRLVIPDVVHPAEVDDAIQASLAAYEELHAHRIRA